MPVAAEEEKTAQTYDDALQHCHHKVHPFLLHHHLVDCSHYKGQHIICSAEDGDWLRSAISPGPAPLQGPWAGRQDCG